jgi:hypothetical protein
MLLRRLKVLFQPTTTAAAMTEAAKLATTKQRVIDY